MIKVELIVVKKDIDFSNIKLVIFDCDGVLIDSEWLCIEVLLKLLKQFDVDVDKHYFYEHFLGRQFEQIINCSLNDFNIELPNNFEKIYQTALLETFHRKLLPCPNITTVLQQLIVPKCVATSSYPARTQTALSVTNLTEHFLDSVFTATEVENGKPAPDLFLHAAKKMNVEPSQCLVIEDSGAGLLAAQSAGMSVIHYIGGKHFEGDVPFEYPKNMNETLTLKDWSLFKDLAPNLLK